MFLKHWHLKWTKFKSNRATKENYQEMTIAFLLLVLVATLVVGADIQILNEIYRKFKGEIWNFTTIDQGYARSKIQCFTKCIGESACLGVGLREGIEGGFRCSKLNNGSDGISIRPEGLIYLKGITNNFFHILILCLCFRNNHQWGFFGCLIPCPRYEGLFGWQPKLNSGVMVPILT